MDYNPTEPFLGTHIREALTTVGFSLLISKKGNAYCADLCWK